MSKLASSSQLRVPRKRRPPLGLMPPTWLLLSIGLMAICQWFVPVFMIVPIAAQVSCAGSAWLNYPFRRTGDVDTTCRKEAQ